MKLPELKKYFKNKYVIRIVAGVLMVSMAGTGSIVYGANALTATKETDLAEELNIQTKEKCVGKEETVYVITDSTGKVEETIVSDHLLNTDNEKTITDASTLTDIENVKGEETFTREGDVLTWQAEGNDIYYQGTSEKEVPIAQKITYYLDGKEIAPEKLAGQSGKVTMRFDYTNQEKSGDVFVPFVALTGMILDESFTEVEVTNGKVISDGNSQIVAGYTLPGLKESLEVEDADFDSDVTIPEYFEVTAQVEEFSLETAMTVVMNAADFVNVEAQGDDLTIDEMIQTLGDAAQELQDGAGQLADGTQTLQSKLGEFAQGTTELQTGIYDYTAGASDVNAGIGRLENGIHTLADKAPALVSGVNELKNGTDEAAAGVKDLTTGAKQVSSGVSELVATVQGMNGMLESNKQRVYTQFTTNSGMSYDTAKATITSLQHVLDALKTGISYDAQAAAVLANGGLTTDQNYIDLKAGAAQYYQAASAAGYTVTDAASAANALVSITNSIASLQNGIGQVDGAVSAIGQVQSALAGVDANKLQELTDGAAAVADGAESLENGIGALQSGATLLDENAGTLGNGASELQDGVDELAAGSSKLVKNNQKLKNGITSVCKATGLLKDGVEELNDGASQLSDGMTEFNETGIEKIVNSYQGEIKPLLERLQEVIDVGEAYQTYTALPEGMEGSVKFIYKTGAIKQE